MSATQKDFVNNTKRSARVYEKRFARDEHTFDWNIEDFGEAESDYPEGGRDAILTVFGALLVNFVALGLVAVTGALQAM